VANHRFPFHRIFPIFLSLLAACNFPGVQPPLPTDISTTPLPTSTPVSTAPLGTVENPIVLAAIPSKDLAISESAQSVAAQLSELTGLAIVPAATATYKELVAALGAGRVHIAVLPPLAYLLAHENGSADAALEITQSGRDLGAVEFLVNTRLVGENKFRVYFDPATDSNLAEATSALKQFEDMKPCWTDETSAVGYVLPFGLLLENKIPTRTGAFLRGDSAVVKSLYLDPGGDICQFGAALADSRAALASEYPDVNEKVVIVWRSEPLVPFDGIAFAASLPGDARISITAAFLSLLQTEAGRAALRDGYQITELKLVDDTLYAALRHALEQSGLDLETLVH